MQALISCLCKSLLVSVAQFLKHKQAQTLDRHISSLYTASTQGDMQPTRRCSKFMLHSLQSRQGGCTHSLC